MATCTTAIDLSHSLIENTRKCDLISNLPDHIFSDIMVMLGRENLEDLQKCRQVCKIWNVMISQMTKLKKDTIRKEANSLTAKIRDIKMLHLFVSSPKSLYKIITAASLAHHGMLASVWRMCIYDVDLASVPAEHLASLVSCVSVCIVICNVRNCDFTKILNNVKCPELYIKKQTLSSEETQVLVKAMEYYVAWVELEQVSLDNMAMTQYSGQGKCRRIVCWAEDRNTEELRRWAKRVNWVVMDGAVYYFSLDKRTLRINY